ncbi:helix-turn-helix domain-containing protein [Paenibacillus sp. GCM10027626]|uniref:AraC family transcriptional regulator n=1 Tax=Paenibacillus sp. GCM10027626 TaxID=3273411 RepID=UPI00363309A1
MIRPFTYSVVSNPHPHEHGYLYILFTGESQTKPRHRIGPKVYDFYLMHHIITGKGSFSVAGEHYELHAGQSFLIRPEQLIHYEADQHDPWHYRWIAFEGSRAEEWVADLLARQERPIIDTGRNRRIPVIYRNIEHALRKSSLSRAAHLRSAGYLHLLFAELAGEPDAASVGAARAGSDTGALVEQVVRYLSTQYAEPVSIERMAETLGYNRAYISRIFKQHTGMTPVTFLLKLRIDKARQLLRERLELTVEQIAASAGFQDPLYFSKQFRRFYNQSPTAYREEMRRL